MTNVINAITPTLAGNDCAYFSTARRLAEESFQRPCREHVDLIVAALYGHFPTLEQLRQQFPVKHLTA